MSYIFDRIRPLIDRLTDPLLERLRRAPTVVVVLVLSVLGLIALAIYRPEFFSLASNAFSFATDRAIYYTRVGLNKSDTIPFSSQLVAKLKTTRQRITTSLDTELSDLDKGSLTAWSASQAIVSVAGSDMPAVMAAHKQRTIEFIYANAIQSCKCWSELSKKEDDIYQHTPFISGWVLHALSDMKVPASSEVIDRVISDQHEEGWWSTFPANTELQFASTYATAWALLGLFRQKQNGYIEASKTPDVENALKRGTEWLISVGNDARWSAYPKMTDEETESESISGLVLHTLNVILGEEAVHELNQQWLNRLLLSQVISAGDAEKYYIEVPTSSGKAIDHFEQLKMPWMTVATVDAFASGSISQQAKALEWLEHALNNKSVSALDKKKDWWRAEVLYALNYAMQNEK